MAHFKNEIKMLLEQHSNIYDNLDREQLIKHVIENKEAKVSANGALSSVTPKDTWSDRKAYDERAKKLALQFAAHFDKVYGKKNIDAEIAGQCPGK